MAPRGLTTWAFVALFAVAGDGWAGEPQGRGRGQQQREQMRFQGMDVNGDGMVTRKEWRGSDASFRQHDWNGDGVLSGDEVRPGARRPRIDDDRFDPRQRFDDWTADGFASLDHNRDGRITRDEWHFDRESFVRADRNRDDVLTRAEFIDTADLDLDREDRFEYLDTNNNGRIERAEWHGSLETFRWLDRNRDGVLSRVEVVGDEENTQEADLFASVDFNRDGRISPEEWHWSRRSFLRQDANGDGVISRAEFSPPPADATGTTGAGSATHVVVVDPRERWVDTGIDLRPGESFSLHTDGSVRLSNNADDTATGAGTNRRAASAPMPDQPAGALIARIGNAPPLLIGSSTAVRTAASGGRLYLGVNDDHLADNAGQYRVTVTIGR